MKPATNQAPAGMPASTYREIASAIRNDARAAAAFIVALALWARWFMDAQGDAALVWIALAGMTAALLAFTHAMVAVPGQAADAYARAHAERISMDPWQAQLRMMEISGQAVASRPVLNKTGALYGALVMEEAGETFRALALSLASASRMAVSDAQHAVLGDVCASFNHVAGVLEEYSAHVRKVLAGTEDFELLLSRADAVELLDGTTDVTVVNCGLALALGLPGAAGYDEVQRSNLSKANPRTGVIDKDPGGKWIKGPNYAPPMLGDVLAAEAHVRTHSEPGL